MKPHCQRRLVVALLVLAMVTPTVATASTTAEANRIVAVDVTPLDDEDGDGAAAAFEITVRADTTLEDTDLFGFNPGEPYFELEIDGEDVARTGLVERSSSFSTTITLTAADLEGLARGDHELTVELWDRDGDDFDRTDFGNDDRLDHRTVTLSYEPPSTLAIDASRRTTTVGSPVSFRIEGGSDRPVEWSVVESPDGSRAGVQPSASAPAVSLRPDVAGEYVVAVASRTGDRRATVRITATNGSDLRLLRRYAPRLHYDRETVYFPTRYEAFVDHARLEEFGEPNDPNPTTFDLAEVRAGWELDLAGSPEDYPRYDDDYPHTVYGSVHPTVTYDGETYTALTYWLFYLYDPKQGSGVSGLFAHQSDLETVTVLLQDGEPKWVGAAQHYGGELREWSKVSARGTHLDLYPAVGAHSNYLRNTDRFGDAGIPMQRQFLLHDSLDPTLVDPSGLLYADETGDDVRITNGRTGAYRYRIVPLTGDEIWASYRGSFGPDDHERKVPFARERWGNPGRWIARNLVADERQIDGHVEVSRPSVRAGTLEASLSVANTGAKPHVFWVVVEAKPPSTNWARSSAVRVQQRSVPVPVGETRPTTVSMALPDGDWDVRVRLLGYRPSVAEAEDVVDTVPLALPGETDPSTTAPEPTRTSGPVPTSVAPPTPTTLPGPTATTAPGPTATATRGASTPTLPATDGATPTDRPGTTTARGRSATVAKSPSSTPSPRDETPGFGVGVTLLAVLALVAYSRLR